MSVEALVTTNIANLRQQAERCHRLAAGCGDDRAAHSLRLMGEDFTARAVLAETEAPIEILPPLQQS
jgi:hypothetical protein